MDSKEATKILQFDRAAMKAVKPLREKSIFDAIALTAGPSQDQRVHHAIWKWQNFEVGVAKPGKEADPERKTPNKNDMRPYVRKDGEVKPENATFKDISRELEHNANKGRHALELLGCLFIRSAFMLDHEEQEGFVRYAPPEKIVEEIKNEIPVLYGLPLEVFLQYVELIALNEDVKYYTKGKPLGSPAGRPNNLLSCAHFIAVLLGRAELTDLAYGFAMMRGVSPMSQAKAKVCFPMLGHEVVDAD